MEIKASRRWDRRFHRGLRRVREELGEQTRCYGIYLGERAALIDDVHVLPVPEFLKKLWNQEVLV
jgi:hypothetical protein